MTEENQHLILRKEIFGHEDPKNSLKKCLLQNRLPHAFCFQGPKGVGKESVAKQFIAYDMCLEKSQNNFLSPCGQCEACQKLARGNHPDYIWIEAESKKIKIDQIREILRQAHFRPMAHCRRWILINDAETMTEQAQNALLRTLEEPPADTHFVLINHVNDQLLPTIHSRCQNFRFGPLQIAEVQRVLLSLAIPENELPHLVALANGAPGHALQCQEENILEIRKEILTLLGQIPHLAHQDKRRWNYMLLAQKLAVEKKLQTIILEIMQSFFRDVSLYHMGIPAEELVNRDHLTAIQSLGQVPLENVMAAYGVIQHMFADFRFNTSPELTFNHAFQALSETYHE